jgi:PEP-CTERM motif
VLAGQPATRVGRNNHNPGKYSMKFKFAAALASALLPVVASAGVITGVQMTSNSPSWVSGFSHTGTSISLSTVGATAFTDKEAVFNIEVDGGAGTLAGDIFFGCMIGTNAPNGGARSSCPGYNGYSDNTQTVDNSVEFAYVFNWFTADLSGNQLRLRLNAPVGGIAYVGFNYYFEQVSSTNTASSVPEPASLALAGLALAGMALTRRKTRG